MPGRNARKPRLRKASRATQRIGLATLFLIVGSKGLQNAVANGDTRTISMHHTHSGEDITVTFKREGRYNDDGLKKVNWFLRDWRTDEPTKMEPQLLDAVWEVQREFGKDKVIHIISAYRSPNTNAMLRRRSGGVARHSLHMLGKAMDFHIPGVPLEDLRAAGLRLQRGGVGFYPSSGSPFVHMDVGNVRHWPRMTREQLVRVFPNQRTVHLPTNGQPLAGYAMALADIEKRGSSPSAVTLEAARNHGVESKPNIFARMFGGGRNKAKDEDDEAEATAPAAPAPRVAAGRTARPNIFAGADAPKTEKAAAPAATVAAIPMPKTRPNFQVAAAAPQEQPARPVQQAMTYLLAAVTPNDIIKSRGYWVGLPETPSENSAARRRPVETASADPAATASIGPFAAPEGYRERKDEATLAFAAHQPDPPVQRARPMGSSIPRKAAIAANTTVAVKGGAEQPAEVISHSEPEKVALPDRHNSPWLRAVIVTPSIQSAMSTTLFGPTDFRNLRPLLQKPASMVVMTFSADPHLGVQHQRFTGSAISFLATATLGKRTASLR